MTDIEDIVGRSSETLASSLSSRSADQSASTRERTECAVVVPKRRQREGQADAAASGVPGTATVYVKTYGCGHNASDGEYMMGILAEQGYRLTDSFDDQFDVALLNSCTVKTPSEQAFTTLMDRVRARQKPLVLAGCVPQGDPKNEKWNGCSVIGVQQIHRVADVIEEALQGNTVRLLARRKGKTPSLDLPKIRRNPLIEIIPINVGCLNNCTYCKTKAARGDLASWPVDEVVARVRAAVADGVKEIRLTSEDTGAYGIDLGISIVDLLQAVVQELPDGVMLRLGMTNPPYIKRHVQRLADLMLHPNVFEFLHVPVQAGNDRVLDVMKREYTADDFRQVVSTLLHRVPGMTVATDVICGFPTETEAEFQQTLDLVDEFQFAVLNISQFYARPNTPAAQMARVNSKLIKDRSRRLTRLFDSFQPHRDRVGRVERVWCNEIAHDQRSVCGHTKNFVQVLLSPVEAQLGKSYMVKITEAGRHFVRGKVVSEVVPSPSTTTRPTAAVDHRAGGVVPKKSAAAAAAAVTASGVVQLSVFKRAVLFSLFMAFLVLVWLLLTNKINVIYS